LKEKELFAKLVQEILRMQDEEGIDIIKMPEEEMDKWIAFLARRLAR
jgi:hypothetical protein